MVGLLGIAKWLLAIGAAFVVFGVSSDRPTSLRPQCDATRRTGFGGRSCCYPNANSRFS